MRRYFQLKWKNKRWTLLLLCDNVFHSYFSWQNVTLARRLNENKHHTPLLMSACLSSGRNMRDLHSHEQNTAWTLLLSIFPIIYSMISSICEIHFLLLQILLNNLIWPEQDVSDKTINHRLSWDDRCCCCEAADDSPKNEFR
jgi:hypothetical protein